MKPFETITVDGQRSFKRRGGKFIRTSAGDSSTLCCCRSCAVCNDPIPRCMTLSISGITQCGCLDVNPPSGLGAIYKLDPSVLSGDYLIDFSTGVCLSPDFSGSFSAFTQRTSTPPASFCDDKVSPGGACACGSVIVGSDGSQTYYGFNVDEGFGEGCADGPYTLSAGFVALVFVSFYSDRVRIWIVGYLDKREGAIWPAGAAYPVLIFQGEATIDGNCIDGVEIANTLACDDTFDCTWSDITDDDGNPVQIVAGTGGSVTLSFSTTGENCPPSPCSCTTDPKYQVTPDILSNAISYFNPGVDFPAGTYCIAYRSGAVDYSTVYDPAGVFRVNRFGALDRFCYRIVYQDGAGDATVVGPGLDSGFATQHQVELANQSQSVSFVHNGGPIGMWLDDTFEGSPPDYHYLDNATEAGGSAPMFELCLTSLGTTATCPTACEPTCCRFYDITLSGSVSSDGASTLAVNPDDTDLACQWYNASDGAAVLMTCEDGVWTIVLYDDSDFDHPLTFTAPADDSGCPPTTGWTLQDNPHGGTPSITVTTHECP